MADSEDQNHLFDATERFHDPHEALRQLFEAWLARTHTAHPVVAESHDPKTNTVDGNVAIKLATLKEGEIQWNAIPKITMPTLHLGGGGMAITIPVAKGDEGLAVFASRSIDNWFTQGGIQSQFASRMHDLSDGFFIPGFRSVPQALPSVDTTSMQMRTTDGKTNFSFNPTGGGSMTMTAPNNPTAINGKGFNTDVENSHQKASGQITLDTPMTKATGKVDASQGFFVNGVPIGSGGGGGGGGGGGSPGPNPPAAPVVGNFWWDSIGGQLYVWYDDGNSAQWVAATNQTGPPGAPGPPGPPDGNTIWNGSGGPTVAIGENGDFYIDNLAHVIYGPKTLGAWPTPGISLIGPAGAPGAPGSTGPRGPAGPAGADSTVPGPPGAIGPQGPNGPQGVAGPTGPQGPQGVQGNIGAQGPQGSMGPQGPQGDTGAMGPQGVYQTGPGLFLNTGTTPPTIDVATPYLPLTGGTLSGALIGTSFQGPHQGTVGAVTPNTGAFTMLTASGTVSGAGFIALLSPYAPLASPVFTGVPSLPTGAIGITQTAGTSNTSLATTAFVTAAITAAPNKTITITGDIAGSGTTAIVTTLPVVNANVGTFNNISVNAKGQVIGANNSTYITGNQTITISGDATGTGTTAIPLLFATVNANVGTFQGLTINAKGLVTAASNQNYAPLASPLFTGNPQAPTPLTADNSISIATTAWVKAQGYTGGSGVYLPLTGGTISGNLTVSGGVLTLNNGTSNWIYTPGLGYASPSFGTRSVGTKFVLFDGLGTTSADYALGIEGGTMWLSVPLTTNAFNWYGGTTLAMTLYGTGNLLLHGTLTLTNATQASVIFNNTVPAITAGGLWRFTVGTGGNMNLTANTAAAGDFSTSTTSFYSTPTGIFYYGNPAFATFTPAGGGAGALLLTGAGGGAVAANGLAVKGISGGGEINLIPGSSVNTGYIEWRLPNAAVGAGARHAYLGWNSGTTFGLQLETATVFAISGALAITDPTTNSLTSLNLSAVNDGNGVNFKMTGNGATTPSKTIRVLNGNLEIVNNAYTAVPFQLTDAGNLTVGGQITAGGTYLYFSNATGNVNAAGGCFFFSDQNNTIAHLGTGNGAFAVQNTSGSQIHTFNANGNATHSGNVAAANIFLTSNWITFAGGSGTNNGPGIAGDATNFTMRMGTGNGGFYIQNNAGTVNYHVFTVDGNASHNGLLTTGTGVTANGGAFQKLGGGPCYRMSPATNNTSIGSMWYTDTSNMYLLLTNNNDAWGTWNGLRPLTVTLSNGNITFGHGVYCNTGLTMTTSTASNVIQCNNGSNWLQLFDDGNGHIECNTNLWLNGNNTGNQVIVGGQLTVQGHFNLNGMDIYNNGWFYVAAGVLAGGNGLYSYAGLHADGACSIGGGLTVNGASSLAAVTVNGVETINGGSQAQSYHTVGSSAMLSFDNRNAPNNFGWYASSDWAYLWHSAAGNMFQFTNLNFAPVTGNSANCGMNGQAWGNVYSLGYPGSSSRNLKTDIAELSPALEKISALRAVQFRWRQDKVPDNRVHYGFVADEVATVIGEDWGGYHRDGEHEAVDKTELVAVLWKACQELAASNSALTTRVEALEARYVS